MKRRVGKTTRLGFRFAKSQINSGRMVAAVKNSKPEFRKLKPFMV